MLFCSRFYRFYFREIKELVRLKSALHLSRKGVIQKIPHTIIDVSGHKVTQLKLTKIKPQKLEGLGLYYSIRKKRNDLIICLNDSTEVTAGNLTQVLIFTYAKGSYSHKKSLCITDPRSFTVFTFT